MSSETPQYPNIDPLFPNVDVVTGDKKHREVNQLLKDLDAKDAPQSQAETVAKGMEANDLNARQQEIEKQQQEAARRLAEAIKNLQETTQKIAQIEKSLAGKNKKAETIFNKRQERAQLLADQERFTQLIEEIRNISEGLNTAAEQVQAETENVRRKGQETLDAMRSEVVRATQVRDAGERYDGFDKQVSRFTKQREQTLQDKQNAQDQLDDLSAELISRLMKSEAIMSKMKSETDVSGQARSESIFALSPDDLTTLMPYPDFTSQDVDKAIKLILAREELLKKIQGYDAQADKLNELIKIANEERIGALAEIQESLGIPSEDESRETNKTKLEDLQRRTDTVSTPAGEEDKSSPLGTPTLTESPITEGAPSLSELSLEELIRQMQNSAQSEREKYATEIRSRYLQPPIDADGNPIDQGETTNAYIQSLLLTRDFEGALGIIDNSPYLTPGEIANYVEVLGFEYSNTDQWDKLTGLIDTFRVRISGREELKVLESLLAEQPVNSTGAEREQRLADLNVAQILDLLRGAASDEDKRRYLNELGDRYFAVPTNGATETQQQKNEEAHAYITALILMKRNESAIALLSNTFDLTNREVAIYARQMFNGYMDSQNWDAAEELLKTLEPRLRDESLFISAQETLVQAREKKAQVENYDQFLQNLLADLDEDAVSTSNTNGEPDQVSPSSSDATGGDGKQIGEPAPVSADANISETTPTRSDDFFRGDDLMDRARLIDDVPHNFLTSNDAEWNKYMVDETAKNADRTVRRLRTQIVNLLGDIADTSTERTAKEKAQMINEAKRLFADLKDKYDKYNTPYTDEAALNIGRGIGNLGRRLRSPFGRREGTTPTAPTEAPRVERDNREMLSVDVAKETIDRFSHAREIFGLINRNRPEAQKRLVQRHKDDIINAHETAIRILTSSGVDNFTGRNETILAGLDSHGDVVRIVINNTSNPDSLIGVINDSLGRLNDNGSLEEPIIQPEDTRPSASTVEDNASGLPVFAQQENLTPTEQLAQRFRESQALLAGINRKYGRDNTRSMERNLEIDENSELLLVKDNDGSYWLPEPDGNGGWLKYKQNENGQLVWLLDNPPVQL